MKMHWMRGMFLGVSLALLVAGVAVAQGPVVAVGILVDSSGSILSPQFDLMLNGIGAAVEDTECIPHDGSVELSVVQFGTDESEELEPTVITSANAASVATTIRNISKGGGSTNMTEGFMQMLTTMQSSANFATTDKQVINLSTDGDPNSEVDAVAARDAAITAGVDEIDAEGIGDLLDVNFLKDEIVYPQPGHLVDTDGYVPGWVDTPSDFEEYAAGLCTKFQQIIPEPEEEFVPEPGAVVLLGSGLMGLAGYATLRLRLRP